MIRSLILLLFGLTTSSNYAEELRVATGRYTLFIERIGYEAWKVSAEIYGVDENEVESLVFSGSTPLNKGIEQAHVGVRAVNGENRVAAIKLENTTDRSYTISLFSYISGRNVVSVVVTPSNKQRMGIKSTVIEGNVPVWTNPFFHSCLGSYLDDAIKTHNTPQYD